MEQTFCSHVASQLHSSLGHFPAAIPECLCGLVWGAFVWGSTGLKASRMLFIKLRNDTWLLWRVGQVPGKKAWRGTGTEPCPTPQSAVGALYFLLGASRRFLEHPGGLQVILDKRPPG